MCPFHKYISDELNEHYASHKMHLAKKYRFELKHPCDGEEHRWVIGHKRRARENLVAAGSIKFKELPAYRVPAPLARNCGAHFLCCGF